jgi:hypothetical protein
VKSHPPSRAVSKSTPFHNTQWALYLHVNLWMLEKTRGRTCQVPAAWAHPPFPEFSNQQVATDPGRSRTQIDFCPDGQSKEPHSTSNRVTGSPLNSHGTHVGLDANDVEPFAGGHPRRQLVSKPVSKEAKLESVLSPEKESRAPGLRRRLTPPRPLFASRPAAGSWSRRNTV